MTWQNLGPVWSEAITQALQTKRSSVRELVRVAGKKVVRIPANSVTTVLATGRNSGSNKCFLAVA